MSKRGTCAACNRGPFSLTGGICGECGKHRQAGELVRNNGGWKWLIPIPDYVTAADPKPEEYHNEVYEQHKPEKPVGICRCCKREMKIYHLGLCGSCYRYYNEGRLTEPEPDRFEWDGEPPSYYQEAMVARAERSFATMVTPEEKAYISNAAIPNFNTTIQHTRGSILDRAKEIINGERQDQYGSPEDSFALIAEYWHVYLASIHGKDLNAKDVAVMMVLFKLARQANQHKEDNIIDAAGYLGILGDMEAE